MSFLKDLTSEFKNLKSRFGDKEEESSQGQQRGESDSFYGQGQQQPPPQQGYGYGAPQQPYGAPQQQPYGQYSQGAPPDQYGHGQPYGAPPPPSGPPGQPPLPPGWHSQWDPNSQRYYFVEQATGRTTWEPPTQAPTEYRSAPPPPGDAGLSYPPYGGQQAHGMSQYPEGEKKKEKKDNSMLYGVGGLAAGALIGGVVAHEMSKSISPCHCPDYITDFLCSRRLG